MKRTKRNVCLTGIGVAALGSLALVPGHALAATTSTSTSTSAMVNLQVIATGLNVPRGVVYDSSDNRLLIAEAGVASENTGGKCSPAGANGTVCLGLSGSIYSYVLPGGHGPSGRIVTGLPSLSDPTGDYAKGLEDLSLYNGQLTGAFSLSGDLATRKQLGAGAADLGQAVSFGADGKVTPILDVAKEEKKLYGSEALTDAWGITTGSYGTLVTNGDGVPAAGTRYGGNDVLQVADGKVSQMVAFPERPAAGEPKLLVRAAPDAVVQGPDGAFYVGELTSYPYPDNGARIWRVVPGHKPTVWASGLSKVIGMAFDPSGDLFVLEDGHYGQYGSLVKISPDGTKTQIANLGLINPMDVVAPSDNTIYVTNDQYGIGHDGELLKITFGNCAS